MITNNEIPKDTGSTLYVERRQSSRKSTLKAGKIIFNNGHCAVDCTIRDISNGGARLELPCHLDLPGTITLNVSGQPSRDCEIIWFSNTTLGVRFIEAKNQAETKSLRAALLRRVHLIQQQLNELRDEIEASVDR